MVNILLGILKGIGILLAVVFILILLVIAVVLMGPIGYRVSGKYREEKEFQASISWIGFVLRAKADYRQENGLQWAVRLFGLLIASNDEEFIRKKEEKKRLKASKTQAEMDDNLNQDCTVDKIPKEISIEEPIVNEKPSLPEKTTVNEKPSLSEEPVVNVDETEVSTEHKDSISHSVSHIQSESTEVSKKKGTAILREKVEQIKKKIQQIIQLIKSIPDKIKNCLTGIRTKIDKIKAQIIRILEWKEFFLGERNREGFLHIWKNIKKMILHILPRKLEGKIEFGLEDPYVMGQVLTVLGIFYPVYQDKFTIIPDFENPGFAGDGSLKGRIVPGYLLLRILIAICNREVIRIIKEGKNLTGGNKA